MSKVLTGCLSKLFPSIVSPGQTCRIPGRFAGEGIRIIQDSLDYDYANSTKLGGAQLSLDREKAFDRVDWKFLHKVLDTMIPFYGFPVKTETELRTRP